MSNIMIRQVTIFSKLFFIKLSDLMLLMAMEPDYRVCPHCGAIGCCRPHGRYTRWLIYILNGIREQQIIYVKRVKCKSCKRTHALLADVLIPYSSYSLRFILHVLREYYCKNCTAEALCLRYSIAISTFYAWKGLFVKHANLWLPVLERIFKVSIQSLDYFDNIPKLPSSFFQRYGFSFLQSRKTSHCGRSP